MDRADWQALAEERILAAEVLLAAKLWASAYYVAGYAVEFGLKSCILVRVAANPGLIFEEKTFSAQCWSHNVDNLVELAGLEAVRASDNTANPILAKHWLTVRAWNEQSRFERKMQAHAEELYRAITDNTNGVMPWIRVRW